MTRRAIMWDDRDQPAAALGGHPLRVNQYVCADGFVGANVYHLHIHLKVQGWKWNKGNSWADTCD